MKRGQDDILRSPEDRQEEREELERQIKEFLKSGGKIENIPVGRSAVAIDQPFQSDGGRAAH